MDIGFSYLAFLSSAGSAPLTNRCICSDPFQTYCIESSDRDMVVNVLSRESLTASQKIGEHMIGILF
jgi:hypothetical protein